MLPSLMLTNCLFCGIAVLLLFPVLRRPNILMYCKGIPIFIAIVLVLLKMLVPYEFPFTVTLASKNVLPAIRKIWEINIFYNITIGAFFLYTWLIITILLITLLIKRHRKLLRTLSAVPEIKNEEIIQVLSQLCKRRQIYKRPKIIQLDIHTSPFLAGIKNPVLVLPSYSMSKSEIEFILQHELEHLKNRHVLIKICTEIGTVVYWWNPIVWLLRREAIRAMELQADLNVLQRLSNEDKLSYLHTLIMISKKLQSKQNHNLALSFTLKSSMLEYRLNTALESDCFKKNKKFKTVQLGQILLSLALVLSSFLFTFASYSVSPDDVETTFTINSESDYLILREDGLYDLYIDGESIGPIPSIPEELSELPVHK